MAPTSALFKHDVRTGDSDRFAGIIGVDSSMSMRGEEHSSELTHFISSSTSVMVGNFWLDRVFEGESLDR